MDISALKKSKFLGKADLEKPALLTIRDVEELNIAQEGAAQEFRWCLLFVETEKPLILNSTNGQIIAAMTGKTDMDHWAGTKIVLYHDPTVGFGGKLTGGTRVRAPKVQKAPALPPPPAPTPSVSVPNTATAMSPAPVVQVVQPAPGLPSAEAEDDIPF